MTASGDFSLPRAFREQARVWSQTEFKEYIDKITRKVALHPLEAPDFDPELQLPHRGTLVRQDILQMAHAFYLRRCLGRGNDRFVFVLDGDSGLALSFISAFATWIEAKRADVIVVAFEEHKSNDQRNTIVSDGKETLELATDVPRAQWSRIPTNYAILIIDNEIEHMINGLPLSAPFEWPFHTKGRAAPEDPYPHGSTGNGSGPPCAPDASRNPSQRRSVFPQGAQQHPLAARPDHTPSNNSRAWDRYYLYNPETMSKIIEIYRFAHNWMGSHKTKKTPAMKPGLAKGKIYPKDLFG